MKKHFDVIIIGGGLSGLAAAARLGARNLNVVLLEASPRLGGRCYSYVDEKTGDVVENGQHVLLGAYHNTLEYLEIAGTKKFLRRAPSLALPFFHPNKGLATFKMEYLPSPFHLVAGSLQFKLLSWGDRRKLLRVGLELQRWGRPLEARLAGFTVKEWLKSLGQSEESLRCLWYPIAISVMNEDPGVSSALLFARSLRRAFLSKKSDSAMLIPTVGQTDLYVTAIEQYLARTGVRTVVNQEVAALEGSLDRIEGIRLKSGDGLRASGYICAVPIHALRRMLPPAWRRIEPFSHLREFGFSPIISIHLWFDMKFMEMEYAGLIGRDVQWVFNRRLITGQGEERGDYISCVISGAHSLIDKKKDDLIRIAVDDVRNTFPRSRSARLLHSIVLKEKRATFSPTNAVELYRPGTTTRIRNFFLAGDWTNTGYPATIEGAVSSGFAAAKVILS